ncbi:hypothetical protein J27TS7_26050 [Paenibacillus dendritiformis]|nr:hypothetical protein J27TS7_26050 [Paenibacillus dendritiformis]
MHVKLLPARLYWLLTASKTLNEMGDGLSKILIITPWAGKGQLRFGPGNLADVALIHELGCR